MSLRTRLVLTLGLTLLLLWGLAAAWLMRDLHQQVEKTLDQRLAQSARMVAGLMAQLPVAVWELAITALRNLVDNALRHGPGESPVEVAARIDADGQTLTYGVRDHGPGVDEVQLEQLTRRFWRASRRQGSGLGLAIVAAIAERFGGGLAFSRPEGGGLEARLTLPLTPRSTGPAGPAREATPQGIDDNDEGDPK